MGQCTQKQAEILEKYRYNPNVDFETASRIIDQLAQNGWKRPQQGNQQQRQNRPPQNQQNYGGRPPQNQQRPTGGGNGYQPAPRGRQPQNGNGYSQPQNRGPAPQQNQHHDDDSCTEKQAALLIKFEYDPNVPFTEASRIIDALKANNWQRPDDQGGGYAPSGDGGYQDAGYGDQGGNFDNGQGAPWGDDVPQFG